MEIEKGLNEKFPHCVGAIDGKYVIIQCPSNTGSEHYNYKNSFCIVLMGLVNSEYRFMFADLGSQVRISDGHVFKNCLLWKNICSNVLNIPISYSLVGSNTDLPYVFLGDGAFALNTSLMKPYLVNHESRFLKRILTKIYQFSVL